MNRKTVCILLPALALLLAAGECSYKPEAVGRAREVYIFTDHKPQIELDLSIALQHQIYTPQPGVEFFLKYKRGFELDEYTNRHSILIAGLEQDSAISIMRTVYPALTSNDSFNLYTFTDLWAENQTVMVFVAHDSFYMSEGLRAVRSKLRGAYKQMMLQRLEGITYAKGYNKKLSAQIEKYGFKLKIPDDWYLDERFAAENFVWVHTFSPDRLVFVYWEEGAREQITREGTLALRDSLTDRFYEGDYLYLPLTTAGPYYFRDNRAIRIEGVWQNDSLEMYGRTFTAGGPCISFAFNEKGRFWMVDAMLFYPETPRKKIFWLNQLEVIVASFEPI
jgi:hypothetical protein